jgi:hypothetical protein
MDQYRSLIESQTSLSQIEAFQGSRRIEYHRFETETKKEDRSRLHAVTNWLRATIVEVDQTDLSEIRKEYPGTGQWLLGNTTFKEWFDPLFPTIPPLLWLNGAPGTGKLSNFWHLATSKSG